MNMAEYEAIRMEATTEGDKHSMNRFARQCAYRKFGYDNNAFNDHDWKIRFEAMES